MTPLRRVTAALSSALLLQLSLLGSGTLCGDRGPETGAAAATAAHAMQGMHEADTDAPAACDAAPGADEGCRLPWAPGHCATMSGCAVAALPPVVQAATMSLPAATLDPSDPPAAHSGPAAAPELPPPRA